MPKRRKAKSPRPEHLQPHPNDHIVVRFAKMGHALYALAQQLHSLENDGWPAYSPTDYTRDRVTGTGGDVSLTPTERAAYDRMTGTITKKARNKLLSLIDTFDLQVDKFLDSGKWIGGGDLREAPDLWCESCVRVQVFEPRFRGQLCRVCNDYAAAHNGVWPSGAYIKAKATGTRMTKRVVEELERA